VELDLLFIAGVLHYLVLALVALMALLVVLTASGGRAEDYMQKALGMGDYSCLGGTNLGDVDFDGFTSAMQTVHTDCRDFGKCNSQVCMTVNLPEGPGTYYMLDRKWLQSNKLGAFTDVITGGASIFCGKSDQIWGSNEINVYGDENNKCFGPVLMSLPPPFSYSWLQYSGKEFFSIADGSRVKISAKKDYGILSRFVGWFAIDMTLKIKGGAYTNGILKTSATECDPTKNDHNAAQVNTGCATTTWGYCDTTSSACVYDYCQIRGPPKPKCYTSASIWCAADGSPCTGTTTFDCSTLSGVRKNNDFKVTAIRMASRTPEIILEIDVTSLTGTFEYYAYKARTMWFKDSLSGGPLPTYETDPQAKMSVRIVDVKDGGGGKLDLVLIVGCY